MLVVSVSSDIYRIWRGVLAACAFLVVRDCLVADLDFFADALAVVASGDDACHLGVDCHRLCGSQAVEEKIVVHVVLKGDHDLVLLGVSSNVCFCLRSTKNECSNEENESNGSY